MAGKPTCVDRYQLPRNHREEAASWPLFLELLSFPNQSWAKNASVLTVVVPNANFDHDGTTSVTHSFGRWGDVAKSRDSSMDQGIHKTHGMRGFDYIRARTELQIPADFNVEAMIVLGKRGSTDSLPEQLQTKVGPDQRRSISESISEGRFAAALRHSKPQQFAHAKTSNICQDASL